MTANANNSNTVFIDQVSQLSTNKSKLLLYQTNLGSMLYPYQLQLRSFLK